MGDKAYILAMYDIRGNRILSTRPVSSRKLSAVLTLSGTALMTAFFQRQKNVQKKESSVIGEIRHTRNPMILR